MEAHSFQAGTRLGYSNTTLPIHPGSRPHDPHTAVPAPNPEATTFPKQHEQDPIETCRITGESAPDTDSSDISTSSESEECPENWSGSDCSCDSCSQGRTPTVKPFLCTQCGASFTRKCNMQRHAICHLDKEQRQKPFPCNACQRSFFTRSALNIHIRTHTGEKPFVCVECGMAFRQSGELSRHVLIHTGEEQFPCTLCSSKFSRKENLVSHMETHNKPRPYHCRICEKSYAWKQHWDQHMAKHSTVELPFPCSCCDIGFHTQEELDEHCCINDPTPGMDRKKPYKRRDPTSKGKRLNVPCKCPICGQILSRAAGLKMHMSIHTGVKPFVCKVCNASFRENRILKTHMRTHTGEKPYQCPLCDSRFTVKPSLNRHLRQHMDRGQFSRQYNDQPRERLSSYTSMFHVMPSGYPMVHEND